VALRNILEGIYEAFWGLLFSFVCIWRWMK